MFSLPQPSDQEVVDGLPVVRLSEDAEVLNCLLTMLYPITSMIPNSYDKTLMLLAASQKYDMDVVQSRIRAAVQGKNCLCQLGQRPFMHTLSQALEDCHLKRKRWPVLRWIFR